MQLIKLTNAELDELVASKHLMLPIEQSYLWQEFDNRIDERLSLGVYKVVDASSKIVAIAALTKYAQKGYEWIWIKHGPFFLEKNPSSEIVATVIDAIGNFIRKIEPKVLFFRITTNPTTQKLKAPIHHTMYDKTVVIDLTQSEEELLANMTRSGRYDVRRSLKAGLEFKKVPKKEAIKNFRIYFKILAETADRDGFRANSEKVYLEMLETLGHNVDLYAAFSGKEPVAWAIVTSFAGRSIYYYGAGNELGRKLCAAYGLQYKIMLALKEQGIQQYDMMGIASDAAPNLAKVTGFKTKFSHETVDIHKTYDVPLNGTRYATVKAAKKIKQLVRR